jgi:rhodanese-related sulfurtransferase
MKQVKELVAEANTQVRTIPVSEAIPLLNHPDYVFVDVRDSAELQQEGKIPGAVHAHRGGLEFMIDQTSEFRHPVFASGKYLLFYCLGGGRSALSTLTARRMGLEKVAHIAGGIKAWKEAGGPIEPVKTPS